MNKNKYFEQQLNILSNQIESALKTVASQYGCSMEQAAAAVNSLSDYLRNTGRTMTYMDVIDALTSEKMYALYQEVQGHMPRPVPVEETEKLNQKSDLEIFEAKDKNKPVYVFKNGGTFTVENSQWDMDVLLDPFRITYDDNWIKEALEEK